MAPISEACVMGLTEHTQSFVFAGKQNAHQVDCSVPQGSILIGLRSFVQYTDDITDTIQQHDVSITMHHIFTPTIRNSEPALSHDDVLAIRGNSTTAI